MRCLKTISRILILIFFIINAVLCFAKQEECADKILSPYFFVKNEDSDGDQLPLKSTSVIAHIAGVIADVNVMQVYKNEGKTPLEAIYIFPASTKAAVYGMRMTIGKRTIIAKIEKREEARREYETAKKQGKRASLLEQHRPNVFQMNVANILPGEQITVELSYTELLVPTDRIYEFVYPTVVGPRYSNLPADTTRTSEKWVQNPYLHEGEAPTYGLDITVHIAGGMPVQKVCCPSHRVNIDYDGLSVAAIKLHESEKYGGSNRDYILQYQLGGGKIESGLLLYPGDQENFFLMMLQPPERVAKSQIPPREYIFIVDVSGSMHGFPLNISKKLVKNLIGNLRPIDRFNILFFSGGSMVLSEKSLSATLENIQQGIKVLESKKGSGSTQILPALEKALAMPKPDGYSRTVIIATDGYVRVEAEVFDLIRHRLGDANMFAFGIGSSVNRHIIEGMARVGMGEPFVVTQPTEAWDKAKLFRKYVESPVLTSIEVGFDNFKVHDVEPSSIPDVMAQRPVIVFGKWTGNPRGKIVLRGIAGDRPYTDGIDVSKVKPLKINSALRNRGQGIESPHSPIITDFNPTTSASKKLPIWV